MYAVRRPEAGIMSTNQSTSPGNLFDYLAELEQQATENAFELPEQQTQAVYWDGVGFTLNDQQYVVQIGEVTEILPVPSATPLPGVHPWAKGVANVRGRLIPIVDLGEFLGRERESRETSNRIMVVDRDELSVGLIVDEVQGMVHFSTGNYNRELPESLAEPARPYTTGYYHQDREYVVFSTDLLVNNERFLKAAKE